MSEKILNSFSLRIPSREAFLSQTRASMFVVKADLDSQEHDGTKSQLNGHRRRHNMVTVLSSSHVVFASRNRAAVAVV